MKISEQYTQELFENLNYHATWFPNNILKLGDIGYFNDNYFEQVFTLDNVGIPYEVSKDKAPADYEYTSKSGVSITTKVARTAPALGSNLTKAEAGICIDFNAANAIVFQAGDCEIITIKNKNKLAEDILTLKRNGKWVADYVVITTIVKSKSVTVIVSNESGGKVELTAHASIKAGTAEVATLKTSNKLKYASKVGVQVIAATNLTPLYKASGIKRGFLFAKDKLINRGESSSHSEISNVNAVEQFSELNLEDLRRFLE